jgi:hypothetical protein
LMRRSRSARPSSKPRQWASPMSAEGRRQNRNAPSGHDRTEEDQKTTPTEACANADVRFVSGIWSQARTYKGRPNAGR